MAETLRHGKHWTIEELERLRLLRETYSGKRRGKHCGFHAYLASELGRTVEGVARGVGMIHGHRSRGRTLGYAKRPRPTAVLPILTESQSTYLAAMFEAEGCLVRVEVKHWAFTFIAKTDYGLIAYVKSLVPFASLYEIEPKVSHRRKKKIWYIKTASCGGVLWAIKALRPFCHGYKVDKMNRAETELLGEH